MPRQFCIGNFFYKEKEAEKEMKLNVKEMALIGMLGALGAVLMFFKTPLPFLPPFMDFDLASLPELIGGFALGPFAAVCIIAIRLIVKLATMGTSTMFTGELQNFILSCSFVLPAVIIYGKQKTKESAIKGMVVGTLICAVVAVFSNVYFIIPFYVNLFGMTVQGIIDGTAAINPLVNDMFTLAVFGILPFNIIKFGSTSLLTYIVYKQLSVPIKRFAGRG